jgi:AcrR family transcriptional regulator
VLQRFQLLMRAAPKRRTSEEVRARIVEFAADQFAERGYAATTTRSIAEAAGVSLSVLHRHYATKEELAPEALVAPFMHFYAEFATEWTQAGSSWDADERTREYVRRLYANLRGRRTALLDLLVLGNQADPRVIEDIVAAVTRTRHTLRRLATDPTDDPDFSRIIGALVIGLILLEPFLGDQEDTIVSQVADTVGGRLISRSPERLTDDE